MKSNIFNSLIFCLLFVCRSQAASIDVGTHILREDMTNQIIQIDIAGVDEAQGVNFNIQVADGGPDGTGNTLGPKITRIDIIGGTLGGSTIFTRNSIGQTDTLFLPQVWESTTTTGSETITSNGVLGFVEVDTTGFFDGEIFDLIMSNTVNNPTDLAGIPVDVTDGKIIVMPEPLSVVLVIVGLLVFGSRRSLNFFNRRFPFELSSKPIDNLPAFVPD